MPSSPRCGVSPPPMALGRYGPSPQVSAPVSTATSPTAVVNDAYSHYPRFMYADPATATTEVRSGTSPMADGSCSRASCWSPVQLSVPGPSPLPAAMCAEPLSPGACLPASPASPAELTLERPPARTFPPVPGIRRVMGSALPGGSRLRSRSVEPPSPVPSVPASVCDAPEVEPCPAAGRQPALAGAPAPPQPGPTPAPALVELGASYVWHPPSPGQLLPVTPSGVSSPPSEMLRQEMENARWSQLITELSHQKEQQRREDSAAAAAQLPPRPLCPPIIPTFQPRRMITPPRTPPSTPSVQAVEQN
eukprot:TRINITY_DN40171_c0_g1_i1.p2 TRINITY_DN40171_c0_g1~~TRINITY_DN40171_c0_g1_i1.p2  ORF type:complete len:306 (+),score=73.11 TRINITY_DN40171_c0_g1_i1:93-1010(+)